MTVARELFEDVSRHRKGSLAEVRFPLLLQALASRERTAVLQLRRGPIQKRIIFEYGTPVDCRSNLVHETLSRFMAAQGRLSEEEADVLTRRAMARGVPLGEVLREEGVLDSLELYKLLQQNLAKKLLDGFTWSDGEFELGFDVPSVQSPLEVKVPQLVVTGVTRFSPVEEVNDAVAPLVGTRLVIPPDPPTDPAQLKLAEGQRRVLDSLRSPRRLDELALGGALSHGEVSRLVYALSVLGVVIPEGELAARRRQASSSGGAAKTEREGDADGGAGSGSDRAPAPVPSEEPALPPAELGKLKNEVMDAYLAHRGQDAFDLLGVAPEASVAEIRRRFLRFARRFAPWRFRVRELESVADKAENLFVAGARAFGELMDSEQRNTLIFRRRTLEEKRAKGEKQAPAETFRIETDLLDPAKQFAKGRDLLEGGRTKEALSVLEFAADCDPQNSLYRAEAAWCRYQLSPRSNARQALDELDEALRIDPRAGLAAFYAGEIHRERGEWDAAEDRLRRANQLLAPDRRPIEALKALARERK